MKITIVYDNYSIRKELEPDWGFSALIESETAPPLLFDTGTEGAILLHNMEELGIDPQNIGTILISHDHYDHAGGLPAILDKNSTADIYVPASAGFSIPGRNVIRVSKPIQISENIFSTGELKGIEQSLALKTEKGIVIVVGCSHPGVGEILQAAAGFGKIHGIIGGFHGFREFDSLQGLDLICPCHCTQYKAEIKELFPNQYLEVKAGTVLEQL